MTANSPARTARTIHTCRTISGEADSWGSKETTLLAATAPIVSVPVKRARYRQHSFRDYSARAFRRSSAVPLVERVKGASVAQGCGRARAERGLKPLPMPQPRDGAAAPARSGGYDPRRMPGSRRKGMTPTVTMPSSSAKGRWKPSVTTILRKKSPLFRRGSVSFALFSSSGIRNADWT